MNRTLIGGFVVLALLASTGGVAEGVLAGGLLTMTV